MFYGLARLREPTLTLVATVFVDTPPSRQLRRRSITRVGADPAFYNDNTSGTLEGSAGCNGFDSNPQRRDRPSSELLIM